MKSRNSKQGQSPSGQRGDFSYGLKVWRRQNNIKQASLAEMLGVSQAAVSFWESGRDVPSTDSMKRIQALMAKSVRDELLLEQLFVQRQAGVRALFDFDGMHLLVASRGFQALWPEVGTMEGRHMADRLINEASTLVFDTDLRHAILTGNLGLASGFSERMTDLEVDSVVPHRWHMCFRHHGHRTIIDVVYEPCAAEAEPGITDLVYLDSIRQP